MQCMIAGGLGGTFGDLLMHSIDTVKVRTVRSGFSCLGLKPESQEEQNNPHTPPTCFATHIPGVKKHC